MTAVVQIIKFKLRTTKEMAHLTLCCSTWYLSFVGKLRDLVSGFGAIGESSAVKSFGLENSKQPFSGGSSISHKARQRQGEGRPNLFFG